MSTTEKTYLQELEDTVMPRNGIVSVDVVVAETAARVLADARVYLRERLWAIAAGELAEWAEAHGIDLETAR